MGRKKKDYFEYGDIVIGREDEYEITVSRKPGDEGWVIKQGEEEDLMIALPDDDAAQNLIDALTRLLELSQSLDSCG